MATKKSNLIWFIVILALIIRLFFVFHSPLRIWDETVYANIGYDLIQSPLHYSLESASWSDFIPEGDYPYSWPNIGFRAPLLPYTLSIFYLLHLDFLILFFIPVMGAISVYLLYILTKRIFNEKIAIYSALFFALVPLHVINSGFILTGVYSTFWILLGSISFWKGYEENDKKQVFLCGIFLGLAVLARYTTLWVLPIFPVYLVLTRGKKIEYKKSLITLSGFILILIPWFIYGKYYYGSFLGAFIHGCLASTYWGGLQDSLFYFRYWYEMFSIIGITGLIGLIYSLRDIKHRGVILFGLFLIFFLFFSLLTSHKEQRFVLPLVIPLCIFSGILITKMENKKIVLSIIFLLVFSSLFFQGYSLFMKSYNGTNYCFKQSMGYFESLDEDFRIINDESSVIYYYIHNPVSFFPQSKTPESIQKISDEKTYLLYTDANMPLYVPENQEILNSWNENFDKVFECDKDWGISIVYKIR